MHFGVVMFPTDYAMRVDDLARAVEARGFESLWFPEHTHIPVSRRSPWPGGPTLPYMGSCPPRIWAPEKNVGIGKRAARGGGGQGLMGRVT